MQISKGTATTIVHQSEPNAMVGGDLLGKSGFWMTPLARGATTMENAMVNEKFVRQSADVAGFDQRQSYFWSSNPSPP